ncbi:hypothetical protein PGT21_015799 [Puccinia graminis f. sp. tritici]|uniref:Uncharacterized protein n=1 Tax=Puccinia graminis f. sp. tritici TaxID=56615 RepID=A0A5B0MKQ2_PUCGR|nr:hypothetical protein PGT21_015799 [Puccinia graminis f. sp. tritici]
MRGDEKLMVDGLSRFPYQWPTMMIERLKNNLWIIGKKRRSSRERKANDNDCSDILTRETGFNSLDEALHTTRIIALRLTVKVTCQPLIMNREKDYQQYVLQRRWAERDNFIGIRHWTSPLYKETRNPLGLTILTTSSKNSSFSQALKKNKKREPCFLNLYITIND